MQELNRYTTTGLFQILKSTEELKLIAFNFSLATFGFAVILLRTRIDYNGSLRVIIS